MTERTYYHGTSDIFDIDDYLLPFSKVQSNKPVTLWKMRRSNKKVRVTNNLEAAQFYANRDAEEKGGNPIVYIVQPDMKSLLKVSKTDFSTVNAKILGVYSEEENNT